MAEKNSELMDKIVSLCKQRGFIFPGSEIYGGLANAWDFGPLGVELKNNLKKHWWKTFVQERMDIVGQDGGIILNPKVWEASGHVAGFSDELIECKNCHNRFRADEIDIKKCPACGKNSWTEPTKFNTMFKTNIGPTEEKSSVAYLRPETAQAIFVDFPTIVQVSRKKLPFGVAQIGKAFRNEITPGNFVFRTREFEQMEIEYFFNPKDGWQKYFDQWLEDLKQWMEKVGIDKSKLNFREIPDGERAHYSQRTIDIEFEFPFGQKELFGLAYRKDYDLAKHKIEYADPETNEKYVPHVIEPSLGVERGLLAILLSAYSEEEVKSEKRVVMKFTKDIAPIKVAVLPLSKKPELEKVAQEIWAGLSKKFMAEYDITGSIGKRYRRQDEIGTPYCVTVDFETLNDQAVTVRDRDTMKQERIKIDKLEAYFKSNL
ncbi:MAG: glycine--tRNA ligase [Candidatus Moranbacteria bacterium]|nr:glycine--tRNA ligase [Candidatus Moranbacteria bacterium]